ncbi:hypothetical protein [Nostoc punctiforme]|uniref:Uncharacterized protein n=1 Tax=Nostoc punctiforme (strain ATCC 29133 / PCC 73102) TaxID=63737 RepID=B2J1H2_NOSP7|nr:hypothetical protein [Nostoc punctiforme]ACC80333.1 hypothetical protein Npun_R1661 [Nostoc punctiforme PCC 73102]
MNLTDIKPVDIITHIEQNFNRAQATGLNSLIFLALREQTSIAYQHKEYCFEDIPEQIIAVCDSLDEYHLVFLGVEIASWLLGEKKTTKQEEVKNAQPIAIQAIDDQKQPTLLSDY